MTNPIWLTYAWIDNDEGDFDYLVQELEQADIPVIYDKIALIPGRKLWKQIADKISSEKLSGWAYLITPNSLLSSACQEELSYALQRMLETEGSEFPLIGLLHKVSIRDVPLSLRVRLCVNLANPDWIEEIRAGVQGKPPKHNTINQDPYIYKIHNNYQNQNDICAIEIRPRFGELTYWRIAFPSSGPQPIRYGAGPANGGGIGAVHFAAITGEITDIGGVPMKYYGAQNSISPSISVYAVFKNHLPQKFFFGISKEPFSVEADGIIIELSKQSLEGHTSF